ncbi:Ribosome biogenesis protein Kri1 [Spiromyces aspiralis]|uniref:Ribosome biogenesis protein Kri1 n=1 Tax=Spiromyces aspiralis TaxID=68401 RepID=A0ACC1HXS8_9FUNG|nr:Ribosome biogenesis protein Kri1 [Spiromyces aspiralis]
MDLVGEDNGDELLTITINKAYAEKYEKKKHNEELSNLKDKYGELTDEISDEKLMRAAERQKRWGTKGKTVLDFISDSDDSESSVSEEEDEDGEFITPEVDMQIIRTIEAIRNKSKEIYDKNTRFFYDADTGGGNAKKKSAKSQPVYLKDYHRQVILEDGGLVDEEKELHKVGMTHMEEQAMIKKQFKDAAKDVVSADEESGDDELFVKREKSKEEMEQEDEEYRKLVLETLTGQGSKSEAATDISNIKDPDMAFLADYIVNKGWINKDAKRIATYEEIVDDEEDEAEVDLADQFEAEYNFRFEHGVDDQNKAYSRNIDESLRRTDNQRKLARERVKERKQLEKEQKMEEIKRLKNLKRKEIFEKLKKIQEITGNSKVGVDDIDLEGEFDPEKYDAQMTSVFDEGYYNEAENTKPTWADDIDISDLAAADDEAQVESGLDKKKRKKKKKDKQQQAEEGEAKTGGIGDDEFIMDADYLPGGEKFEKQDDEQKAKALDEYTKTINNYLDEYYQLNYEDVIGGDLPTRFKYRQTEPVDFGLTPEEILLADEKDLNEYVSLKKLAPFRPKHKLEKDFKKYAKKKRIKELRKKIEEQRAEWERLSIQVTSEAGSSGKKAGPAKKKSKTK